MARTLRSREGFNLAILFLNSTSQVSFTCTRSLQTLAFEEVRTSPDRPCHSTAFFLHGLLGSRRNWRSFSRSLAFSLAKSASSPAEWRMTLVDLRNHGNSALIEELDPPHDMVNAAKDLADLVKAKRWKWPEVVIGHSMGGKVAMQFAQSCALGHYGEFAKPPRQIWVLDSVPGEVDPENSDGEVEKVLETLRSLPSSIPSVKWLVSHMIELGFPKSLSEWLGSSLKSSGDQKTWTFNLEGAVQMFNSYRETSYWSLLENPPNGMEIAIVRAERSDRWGSDVIQRLESLANQGGDATKGKVSVYVLPNSGHWVHVDNPKGLLEIMAPNFLSPKKTES